MMFQSRLMPVLAVTCLLTANCDGGSNGTPDGCTHEHSSLSVTDGTCDFSASTTFWSAEGVADSDPTIRVEVWVIGEYGGPTEPGTYDFADFLGAGDSGLRGYIATGCSGDTCTALFMVTLGTITISQMGTATGEQFVATLSGITAEELDSADNIIPDGESFCADSVSISAEIVE